MHTTLSEVVYHNSFDSCWRYTVVCVCYRPFLVAPIGQFGQLVSPVGSWERPGFESPFSITALSSAHEPVP